MDSLALSLRINLDSSTLFLLQYLVSSLEMIHLHRPLRYYEVLQEILKAKVRVEDSQQCLFLKIGNDKITFS